MLQWAHITEMLRILFVLQASTVTVVAWLWAGWLRSKDLVSGRVKRLFHSWQGWQWLWTHPPSYLVGTASCLPRRKAARMSVDHTPPSNAKVKNEWSYTSILPCGFMPQWGTILLLSLTLNILLLIESLPCWRLLKAWNSSLKDIVSRQTSCLINYNWYINIFLLDTNWQRNDINLMTQSQQTPSRILVCSWRKTMTDCRWDLGFPWHCKYHCLLGYDSKFPSTTGNHLLNYKVS